MFTKIALTTLSIAALAFTSACAPQPTTTGPQPAATQNVVKDTPAKEAPKKEAPAKDTSARDAAKARVDELIGVEGLETSTNDPELRSCLVELFTVKPNATWMASGDPGALVMCVKELREAKEQASGELGDSDATPEELEAIRKAGLEACEDMLAEQYPKVSWSPDGASTEELLKKCLDTLEDAEG